MDGNRTHQGQRKLPLIGFEGRGTESVSGDDATTYDTPGEGLTDLLTAFSEKCPELASVIEAWPDLPEAIRAGIVAMVRAVGGAGSS